MGRFEVVRVQVDIAGPQAFTLDAHVTTRTGQPSEVIAVNLGQLVVYVYDLIAARAFAAAWRTAQGFAPPRLPEHVERAAIGAGETSQVGMLLRVEGTPDRQKINGIAAGASLNGLPHVRVELGCLSVHAYDLDALRTTGEAWTAVERTAERFWPDPRRVRRGRDAEADPDRPYRPRGSYHEAAPVLISPAGAVDKSAIHSPGGRRRRDGPHYESIDPCSRSPSTRTRTATCSPSTRPPPRWPIWIASPTRPWPNSPPTTRATATSGSASPSRTPIRARSSAAAQSPVECPAVRSWR